MLFCLSFSFKKRRCPGSAVFWDEERAQMSPWGQEGKLHELLRLLLLQRADPVFLQTKQYVQTLKRRDENTDSRKCSFPLCCCLFLATSLLKKDKHSMWYYQSLKTLVNVYQYLSVQNISSFIFGHGLTAVVRKKTLVWLAALGCYWQESEREEEEEKEKDTQDSSRTTSVPRIDFKDQNGFSGADLHQLTPLICRGCLETPYITSTGSICN